MSENDNIYEAIADLSKNFDTKQESLKKDIKEHIDLKMQPIATKLNGHIDEHEEFNKTKRKIVTGVLVIVIASIILGIGGCVITTFKIMSRINIERFNKEFVLPKPITE